MALKVIGAGLGRTATFSMKFALEHLGLGPCYHMSEVLAGARRNIPLWLDVINGQADWDAIFEGYQSTTDYPACTYWRELVAHYPDARVVLTIRDPDSWFDSVSQTIFSEQMQGSLAGSPAEAMMQGVIFDAFGGHVNDRAFMTEWFERRNQDVIDAVDSERLLVYSPKQGWEPLCVFLDVPVPDGPFPRVNSRDEVSQLSNEQGGIPPDPETAERFARDYIEQLRTKAFGG
jgi:Sulfotransferase domain